MTEKFVVRLLDAEGQLLAWAEVWAAAAPQREGASCPFWATSPTVFRVDAAGRATQIAVHWCALDVARRQDLVEALDVEPGQACTFAWIEPVWLVPGMRDVPLPAVTISSPVAIAPPIGTLLGAS